MRFAARVNKTINLAAEKISEETLETVVNKACARVGTELFDFSAYGDFDDARYVFYLERLKNAPEVSSAEMEKALDTALCEANDSYVRHRTNKLFNQARMYWLQPETNMLYRDLLVYRGAAAATIKPVHVITTDFQHKFFDRMTDREET